MRPVLSLGRIVLGTCAALAAAGCASGPGAADARPVPVAPTAATTSLERVGVYDPRAVAIAHYRSPSFAAGMRELVAAHRLATSSGDTARAAELAARAAGLQDLAHRQSFAAAPVDDLLAPFAAQVAAVRERAAVSVLVPRWGAASVPDGAPDVTDDLVRLFDPDEATREVIRQVRTRPPVDADALRDD